MRFLLDSHILEWSASGSERLGPTTRSLLEDGANALYFSTASLWELSIKRGKFGERSGITLLDRLEVLDQMYVEELPIRRAHVLAVGNLPDLHRDPFDRLLVAQARAEGMILLTADRRLAAYGDFVKVAE